MFFTSASAISNYQDCKYKYYFINKLKVETSITIPMALGKGVHSAIELNEDGDLSGMHRTFQDKFLETLGDEKIQIHSPKENVHKYLLIGKAQLEAYNDIAKSLEPLTYPKEYSFKVPLAEDITLVGRIDQIRGGKIYDIKTGEYPPSEEMVKKDLQFTMYAYAYTNTAKRFPEGLYWLHLGYKEKKKEGIIEGQADIIPMENRTDEDFNTMKKIIFGHISDIKDEKFWPEYGYQCRTCIVKRFCIK